MKKAGLLPANGLSGRRARCPLAALPRKMTGAAPSQLRRAPGYYKDTSEPQKGHPPRTTLRSRHPPIPLHFRTPRGSDPRRAPRTEPSAGGAGRQHRAQNSPQAKQHRSPEQATSRVRTGCRRPSRTRRPEPPAADQHRKLPCAGASGCPPLLPQTQRNSNAHGSQLERDSTGISWEPSKTTPRIENQTTLCQPLSLLGKGNIQPGK